jgi:phage terminase large subunit
MIDLKLPHRGWTPRVHQMPLWNYLRGGGKRAMAVWHRRAGKDDICLHHTMLAAWQRPANYAHCLPEFAQGRKAIWEAVNPHTGRRRIDEAFPQELRSSESGNEMFIRFKNGSTWQVIGSDRYDNSLVGSSFAGIVFSEYALANPAVWGYTRPMLEENDGWAVFITTPRGRNHAYDLYNHARITPHWFCELLTARDTDMLSEETLAETLAELQSLYGTDQGTASYRQELFCDWTASVLGAFYALECAQVRDEGRITEIEALPERPVHRAWDLGIGDDTSVWQFQVVGGQLFILNHTATSGVGLEWWRDKLEAIDAEHGWKAGADYVPQDAKVREWTSGRTRVETMRTLGLNPSLVPAHTVDDGINAARRTMQLCVFHPRTEKTGFAALEQYRREWDADKKAFRASAVHDWTSHPADAFRYLAMAWRPQQPRVIKVPKLQGFMIPPPVDNRKGMRL